jgi:predicted CoA-substrate-specific enzyme activase
VLEKANLVFENLKGVVSTGYGRHSIRFANKALSEITCHAKGVYFLIPQARLIIDIGCQDSKIIRINEEGNVTDFVMNDKCAAGTGRFLEVMAGVLGLKIDELGAASLKSKNPSEISSTCTVFAESEVISLRAHGLSREDLVAGIHKSIAKRVAYMASNRKYDRKVVFTGGVSKNLGVIRALEEQIGQKIFVPKEPQLTGALGAALLAQTKIS